MIGSYGSGENDGCVWWTRPHRPLGFALVQMEAMLIHAREPALNRSSGRWRRGVTQYFQLRDERLGPAPEDMIKDMWDATQAAGL